VGRWVESLRGARRPIAQSAAGNRRLQSWGWSARLDGYEPGDGSDDGPRASSLSPNGVTDTVRSPE